MADAAVTFLLENVTQLLKYHVDLVSAGAENELEQLKDELGLFKAFLQETAAKKPKKKEALGELLQRQIREVVYDAEDTIDTCVAQAAAAKAKRRGHNPELVSLEKEVIKSFREDKLKPIFHKVRMDFANYMQIGDGSDAGSEESAGTTRVRKVQLIGQGKAVGFEDEVEIFINHLMEEAEELDVISVIGMPGLGKTTLAWKIYQNEKIQYEFPIRIWVYVSQDFHAKDVFLSILKGFTNQDMSGLSDQELIQTVHANMEKAKFLLVLDDLWSVEAWNEIKIVLPKSNRMGKVIITSRHREVGKHANVTRESHMLRFLTHEESWELLQLEVFGNLKDCPQELRFIGEDIAMQCDGLPLAIVVIGGILLDQLSRAEETTAIQKAWKNVSENVSAYVRNDREQRISDIVALSYYKLPDDLRDCFLYLGVFPEDYEIPARTLTRLWIAEGFIQHTEEQSLEETAEENLQDLINRNLLMVDKTNPMGEVKTCRVHDVIREFCKYRAYEWNLFREVMMSWKGVFEPQVSRIQEYRRLSIHSHLSEFLSEIFSGKLKAPHLRSFLCFCKETSVLDAKYMSAVLDSTNLLRVLHSKSIKFTQFPKKLTNLVHLRYITLSCADLDVLPEAVSELWNLQTLVVETMSRTLEIIGSIWKMIQLRHLKTKAVIFLQAKQEDLGRGAGENLQTLSRLSPEYCTKEVFSRAHNLKRLGIRGRIAILLDAKSLGKLDRLETLSLKNDLLYESASKNPLPGLPPPKCFPPNIKRLTLSATFLDWKHMSTLGMIDTLQELKLKDRAFVGPSWYAVGVGFPSLRFLLIASTDLVFWNASDDHFPSLGCLVLKNCEKLSEIPLSLAKSLHILDIERVAKSAIQSARKIEEFKTMQRQEKFRWGRFKLSIGLGCE